MREYIVIKTDTGSAESGKIWAIAPSAQVDVCPWGASYRPATYGQLVCTDTDFWAHMVSVEKKAERWKELIGRFKAPVAMKVLEAAGKDHNGSRFEWIDFRMAWGEGGTPSPLHLHVCPRGQYSMGTFAHAFVRRGQSNGVRILGTLKTGGDINVLAIYER